MSKSNKLTTAQVARTLRKHKAISALAVELGCHRQTLSSVLLGRTTSARLLAAATEKARQLLDGRAA